MGYKHRTTKTLVQQVSEVLQGKLAIGTSKHTDKATGSTGDKIYSWGSYHTYVKACNRFVIYCHKQHKCKTLDQCRQYAQEWLDSVPSASASTLHTWASSLAKLYSCPYYDLVRQLPPRKRTELTRSREPAVRDAHFSLRRNAALVAFCRATGLRRAELAALTGDKLVSREGRLYVNVDKGAKGGRERLVPVYGDAATVTLVTDLMHRAGTGKVFPKVPSCADIHSYRSDYAIAVYRAHARSLSECMQHPFWNKEHYNGQGYPKGGWDADSVYRCRGDMAGIWYDKEAMRIASDALGHNRISVIAGHYLRNL